MLVFTGLFCLFCASILVTDKKQPSLVAVYSSNGSFQTQHTIKVCTNKDCRTHYHYSFFTRHKVHFSGSKLARFFYDDALQKPYFQVSSCSAFEMDYLRSFYSDMYLCPEYSFYQKATSFNINVKTGNIAMDRRRFTEAFFHLALLDMWSFYNTATLMSTISLCFDLDSNIEVLLSELGRRFQGYHSEHRCSVKGFDADCKVR